MERYIGNIVVSGNNVRVEKYYKKCLSIMDIDKGLPTMIIGLERARGSIDDFNILKRSYNDNMLWWTFDKREKRSENEKDLETFFEFCIKMITHSIEYEYINPLYLNFSEIRKYLTFFKKDKLYYNDNGKFIFVYDTVTNKVFGISLSTCGFWGICPDKIIRLIDNGGINKEIRNFQKIPNKLKSILNFDIPSEIVLSQYFS